MAATAGHGNPDWSWDETILALDLYFRCNGVVPSGSDQRVQQLSHLLRSLPIHPEESKRPSFRNPDGVAFKLQNLRSVVTGKGLGNVSKVDRAVVARYRQDELEVGRLAALISQVAPAVTNEDVREQVEVFSEGEVVTALHRKRERSPQLRKKFLSEKRLKGHLFCEVCLRNGPSDERLSDALFEAHHLNPLAAVGKTETRTKDLALLCASCHRLMHRAISVEGRALGVVDLRTLLGISV